MQKRNANVDLIKVLGAFMVIAVHCSSLDFHRVLPPLFILAIPLFFLEAGFFLFDFSKGVKEKYTHFLFRVIIPLVVLMGLLLFLMPWALSMDSPFHPSTFLSRARIKELLLYFTNWAEAGRHLPYGMEHLWFIRQYILLTILSPLFASVRDKKYQRFYIIFFVIALLALALSDLTHIGIHPVSDWVSLYQPLAAAFILALMGAVIWQNREKLFAHKKTAAIVAAVLFVVFWVLRWRASVLEETSGPNGGYFAQWETAPGVMQSVCFLILLLLIPVPEKIGHFLGKISKCQFYIYIVHFPLVNKYLSTGLRETLCQWIQYDERPILGSILDLVTTLVIFLISLGISWGLSWLFQKLESVLRKLFRHSVRSGINSPS